MAKSVWKKIRGKSSYAMVYKPDEFKGNRFWKINLHMKDETFKTLKELGWQGKRKESNIDGCPEDYASFRRDCVKKFGNKEEKFLPPTVLDKDGNKLVWYQKTADGYEQYGDDILIGNGSEVELKVEIYQTKHFGAGVRLHEVKIIDLIEYVPEEEVDQKAEEAEVVEEEPETQPAKETTPASQPVQSVDSGKRVGKKVSW